MGFSFEILMKMLTPFGKPWVFTLNKPKQQTIQKYSFYKQRLQFAMHTTNEYVYQENSIDRPINCNNTLSIMPKLTSIAQLS